MLVLMVAVGLCSAMEEWLLEEQDDHNRRISAGEPRIVNGENILPARQDLNVGLDAGWQKWEVIRPPLQQGDEVDEEALQDDRRVLRNPRAPSSVGQQSGEMTEDTHREGRASKDLLRWKRYTMALGLITAASLTYGIGALVSNNTRWLLP